MRIKVMKVIGVAGLVIELAYLVLVLANAVMLSIGTPARVLPSIWFVAAFLMVPAAVLCLVGFFSLESNINGMLTGALCGTACLAFLSFFREFSRIVFAMRLGPVMFPLLTAVTILFPLAVWLVFGLPGFIRTFKRETAVKTTKKVFITLAVMAAGFVGTLALIWLFARFELFGYAAISSAGFSSGAFLVFAPLVAAALVCAKYIWDNK